MCTADIGSNATVTVITSNRMEVLLGILGTQTDRGDPTTAKLSREQCNVLCMQCFDTVRVRSMCEPACCLHDRDKNLNSSYVGNVIYPILIASFPSCRHQRRNEDDQQNQETTHCNFTAAVSCTSSHHDMAILSKLPSNLKG